MKPPHPNKVVFLVGDFFLLFPNTQAVRDALGQKRYGKFRHLHKRMCKGDVAPTDYYTAAAMLFPSAKMFHSLFADVIEARQLFTECVGGPQFSGYA